MVMMLLIEREELNVYCRFEFLIFYFLAFELLQ